MGDGFFPIDVKKRNTFECKENRIFFFDKKTPFERNVVASIACEFWFFFRSFFRFHLDLHRYCRYCVGPSFFNHRNRQIGEWSIKSIGNVMTMEMLISILNYKHIIKCNKATSRTEPLPEFEISSETK